FGGMLDAFGMGRNSKLCKHRDAGLHHRCHGFRALGGGIELDHVCSALFHETSGCSHGALDTFLERTIWQVTTDERSFGATANGFANNKHLLHRDFQRSCMAPQVDSHGISNGNDLDTHTIRNLSNLEVPGDDSDDLSSFAFHLL